MDKEILSHCRTLISEGNIDQCLKSLIDHCGQIEHQYLNDLMLLSGQYQSYLADKSLGLAVDTTTPNRIAKVLLEIIAKDELSLHPKYNKFLRQVPPPKILLWGGVLLIMILIILRISRSNSSTTHGEQSPIINGDKNELKFYKSDTINKHDKE